MDKKIVEYDIVENTNPNFVVNVVKTKIAEGWQPYGSLAMAGEAKIAKFAQAIVKYE